VSLPQIRLDDRQFQDLVSEARMRIATTCPDWTEHNVSDPGITLVELFAWMTDILLYRLNRIPDRLHLTLLELLGVTLHGPRAARTRVRFRAGAPLASTLEIPVGTEVGTVRSAQEEAIVFQVSETFAVPPCRPAAYLVERGRQVTPITVVRGVARPQGPERFPFGSPPRPGDALYLGFEEDISHVLLQVEIDGSKARGAGVKPEDPPLCWEVSRADGTWAPAEVLTDRTGGFNYGRGTVELQCPGEVGTLALEGRRLRWLRCRIDGSKHSGEPGAGYTDPPEIRMITAGALGAEAPVEHAGTEYEEPLGISDGTPGQRFRLRFSPALPPTPDEALEVREPGSEKWARWRLVDSFAASGPEDRHFVLDATSGEVELGPAVRQPGGEWTQHGRIPRQGAEVRMSRYRHGGGASGNVASGTVVTLRSALPGIASVTNPRAASGGVDGESLDSARRRASLELRTRYRAVTAEDYEFLVREASSRVARAICIPPGSPTDPVRVGVLPQITDADRQLSRQELTPDDDLLREVASYLDQRRVIGTTVQVAPARLRGVSVVVNVQAEPDARLQRVEDAVLKALYTYLNPLVGGSPSGRGDGWAFGRMLNQGELYQIVHSVEGVQFVKILRIYETDLRTQQQAPQPAGSHLTLEPDELIASGTHIVKAVRSESHEHR
jgi:predicted phage baseplate assembly protein